MNIIIEEQNRLLQLMAAVTATSFISLLKKEVLYRGKDWQLFRCRHSTVNKIMKLKMDKPVLFTLM
jgi:hypothetical protein